MDANLKARVRGTTHGLAADDSDKDVVCAPNGALAVAAVQPVGTEIARMSKSWWAKNTTAAAALTAMPTTTSGITLYNGESSGGLSYIIDSVCAAEIVVDATQSNLTALWVACGRSFTAPTAGTTATGSFSGKKTYDGAAIIAVAATTVVADSPWNPVGPSASAAAVVAGSAWKVTDIDLFGKYIVVPGGAFHLTASKVAATASQLFYVIRWHEAQLQVA